MEALNRRYTETMELPMYLSTYSSVDRLCRYKRYWCSYTVLYTFTRPQCAQKPALMTLTPRLLFRNIFVSTHTRKISLNIHFQGQAAPLNTLIIAYSHCATVISYIKRAQRDVVHAALSNFGPTGILPCLIGCY